MKVFNNFSIIVEFPLRSHFTQCKREDNN